MDHVYAVFKGDANDIILSQIGSNRSQAFSYLVRFVRLAFTRQTSNMTV
jgi:hypothetical protein